MRMARQRGFLQAAPRKSHFFRGNTILRVAASQVD